MVGRTSVTPRTIAIANPDSLRWKAYAAALATLEGHAADVSVVPWTEVISRRGNLDGLAVFDHQPAIVRLESPGRDWDVYRQMLHAADDDARWLTLPYVKGRLVAPSVFHRGFVRVLTRLDQSFADRPHLRPTAAPLDVATMFDKKATCARLDRAGIPIPETWFDVPKDGQAILDGLRECRWPTAYVKLNSGSSADGIAVVRVGRGEPEAISSVLCRGDHFYSSRRLTRTTGHALLQLLNFLAAEGVCVQRGIRMAQVDGLNADVRVVVIHGTPSFTIFRLSAGPMTNLHLGGMRGQTARCQSLIPPRQWLDGLDACIEAAALFDSAVCGVDLVFELGTMRPYVLEVNAFGDFFPGLTDECGRSVYEVEIERQGENRKHP